MKKNIFKTKFTLIVSLFAALVLSCFAFILTTTAKSVYADDTFAMVEGASVYLATDTENQTETVSGIKFMAKVPESLKDKDFTVLIIHKEMLNENSLMTGNQADIDITGDVAGQLMTNYGVSAVDFAKKFTVIERPAVLIEQDDILADGYYVYGSMTRLPEKVFARDFVGFVYYTEGEARTYATISDINDVTRSIAQVSKKALGADFDNYYTKGYVDTLFTLAGDLGDEKVAYQSAYYKIGAFSGYYKMKTQVEVVPYSANAYTGEVKTTVAEKELDGKKYNVTTTVNGTIESPIETQNDYLVKNTILATGEASQSASVPFWFDSADARYSLPQSLRTQLKTLLDAGKQAVLSFQIYNAMGTKMYLYTKDAVSGLIRSGTHIATVANDSWASIEVPLDESAITLGDTAGQDSYRFGVGLEGDSSATVSPVYKDVVDGDSIISSKQIYFTDEISFIEPIVLNGASQTYYESTTPSRYTITRDITRNADYLTNGSNYAIKVSVVNSTGTVDTSGVIESAENCSLTDWSNVVLTADIYNPTDANLEVGLQFVKNNATWTNDGIMENNSFYKPFTIEANSWGTVAWSMRAFGIGSDIFADGVTINLRTKNSGGNVRTYDFAITNLDFVDYDAEKFPDLTTYYGTRTAALRSDMGWTAGDLKTVSFDYYVETVGVDWELTLWLRQGTDNNNIIGKFTLNADGLKGTYTGVTVTKLPTGYFRIVIDCATATTTGSPVINNGINSFRIENWSYVTFYYGNLQVTYNAAA